MLPVYCIAVFTSDPTSAFLALIDSLLSIEASGFCKLQTIAGMMLSVPRILYRMRFMHNWSSLGPNLEKLMQELRQKHPDAHFLCYGYCFGGYVVCKVLAMG